MVDLRAQNRCRGEVFIHAGDEMDAVLVEQRFDAAERELVAAERRAFVAGDERSRLEAGAAIAEREGELGIGGIGVCTGGGDCALIGADGMLVDNPRHYRDARTNGVMERLFGLVPRDEVFRQTGIQVMQLSTLYQFYAMKL